MKRIFLTLLLTAVFISLDASGPYKPVQEEDTVKWNVDKAHSSIRFSVPYMLVSDVDGWFEDYEGEITSQGHDFTTFQIVFKIKTKSIYTGNGMRDMHLKTGDFFKARKYPEMIFKSKSMVANGDQKYKLTGDLTIKEVTKEVVFDVMNTGIKPLKKGKQLAGFELRATINRHDWDVSFNMSKGGMDNIIGEEVDITAKIVVKSN